MTRELRPRGSTSVAAIVLLVAITLGLSAVIGQAALPKFGLQDTPTSKVSIEDVDASENRVVLVHDGGDPLNVSQLEILTYVNGEPLEKQLEDPPYYGVSGFGSIAGEIHSWRDGIWEVSETCSYEIAKTTNSPQISKGDTVTVKVVHTASETVVSEVSAEAK